MVLVPRRDRLTTFSASHLCEESNTKDGPFHSALIQPRLHYRLGPPAGRRCALPCWAIDDVLLLKGSCYYCSLIWLRLKRSVRFSQESNLDLLRGGRGCKRHCCIFNIITGGVNGTPGHLESLWSLSTPRLGRPGARNGVEIQRRSVFLHWLNEAHQVFFLLDLRGTFVFHSNSAFSIRTSAFFWQYLHPGHSTCRPCWERFNLSRWYMKINK